MLRVWKLCPPEADDAFCENVLFCHGFKNDSAIYAFIVYTVKYEMEEKSIWSQKCGTASNSA